MWKYYFENKKVSFASIVVSVIAAVMEVGLALLLKEIVDVALVKDYSKMLDVMLLAGIYIILVSIINYYSEKLDRLSVIKAISYIREYCVNNIMNDNYELVGTKSKGHYINLFTKGMDMIENSYFNIVKEVFIRIVQIAIAFCLLVYISPLMGVFVVVMSLIQICIPLFTKNVLDRYNNTFLENRNRLAEQLTEQFAGYWLINRFQILSHITKRFSQQSKTELKSNFDLTLKKRGLSELCFFFGQIMFIGTYCIGGVLIVRNSMTVSEVIASSQLMTYIAYPLMGLNGYFMEINSCKSIRVELISILNTQKKDVDITYKEINERCDLSNWNYIECKKLDFSYNKDIQVLSGVNYRFMKGNKYVLTGASGSGKSTLLRILSKQYTEYQGGVYIDQCNSADIPNDVYYDKVAYLEQDTFIFDASLKDNVTLFDNKYSSELVNKVLIEVGLKGSLNNNQYELNDLLGYGKIQLSGGEKQRLALARILLRTPSIILVDEGTANLDKKSADLIENILICKEDITVIFVTHNLESYFSKYADSILYLSDNMITELQTLKG